MEALPEHGGTDAAGFARIRAAAEPAVLRGLVADWPVVAAGRGEGVCGYLATLAGEVPVPVVRAAPGAEGRLHYDPDLRGPNFLRAPATLRAFLAELERGGADTLAVQGLDMREALPGFAAAHAMPVLPATVAPRAWIGTAAVVATHSDPLENLACVAAGHRRFTLFPPEAVGDLYMGPFHVTPAGTPVSMVHLTAPDLARYPRFSRALERARQAELAPGDAIYIPYGWYHHVEALDRVNMLVNYWWDPARRDLGSPWDALMHGMMTLRHLPADQRRAWRAMFDHYVFLADGDPGEHLPADARGILAAGSPEDIARMRHGLIAALQRGAKPA
ncbi:cupin-like domain-containing protein [Sphingomonas corticis]|jgi:hypothetical protein|uniref:Cupin-like domain-containing protein n=1 Tax=Sphingomonas corticis TaxID=2722791 RepID=A0ABX1CKQ8_9SPHN|nr:cupin-like domain-containing protein [Sphingomonas corticis]NJR78570.1 cupin-like domain-containing protein [Sphingomonas corticis]